MYNAHALESQASAWRTNVMLSRILGLAVSWRKKLSLIAWIATLAGVVTSWALLVGTRDAAPFAWPRCRAVDVVTAFRGLY